MAPSHTTTKIFLITLLVIAGLSFNNVADVDSMDKGGCLTCHQYPGLVRLEKPDRLRVLHIDEDKYLDSSHGNLDCRECHSQVNAVPHTRETVVNCAVKCHHNEKIMTTFDTSTDCTRCHRDYKDEVKYMDYYLSTFHKSERFAILNLNSGSSCRVCHPLYSHSENNIVRSYLNLHAGFIICEVCHLLNNYNSGLKFCGECHKNESILTYQWGTPEGVDYIGEPFGLYSKNEKYDTGIMQKINKFGDDLKTKITNKIALQEDQHENKPGTEYSISRIGIFTAERGKQKSLMNTWDTGKAVEFKAMEKYIRPSVRERRLKYFHRDIARLEISVVCEECHSSKSIIDYKKLGFDDIKANKLKYLNIKGLVTKYETFYFPKFLVVK